MADSNLTNDDAYLESINKYHKCYVVRDEHHAAMTDFCRIMAEHGIPRVAFRSCQLRYAREFSAIMTQTDISYSKRS